MSNRAAHLREPWSRILGALAESVSAADRRDILAHLQPVALSPTELRLQVPARHLLATISERHMGPLQQAVERVIGRRQVLIEVSPRSQGELFPDSPARTDRRKHAAKASLDPRYTFERFVVGASNQFAHAAARAVATQPGEHYNPLFLYGESGLGKTHLASAIGHAVLERNPEARVAYLTADAFMTELIGALRQERIAAFKRRLRELDVLIVDDVQLLTGRERTQQEFFHTFNSLHGERHQIVLTSDKVPRDIPSLEERLRSRLEWGLIADIQPPDVETRVAILQKKAEVDDLPLDPDVALFLAERITNNVRELESALTRLAAEASFSREPITLAAAERMLGVLGTRRAGAVTFDSIESRVCDHFSVRPAELRSKRRSRHIVVPRQVAMYLCRRLLDASFPRIGQLFDRDHSTVMHSVRTVQQRVKQDVSFQTTVEQLERDIREQHLG